MNLNNYWLRSLVFLMFVISACLLSGYIAVELRYPSLWGTTDVFTEYALPIGLTWGLVHWPSMLILGISLVTLPKWSTQKVRGFRTVCGVIFLLLLLELDNKIPFLLYPKVDLVLALMGSLVLVPPNRNDNPILTPVILIASLLLAVGAGYWGVLHWQHQPPQIIQQELQGGLFRLQGIHVDNDYRKEMMFEVDLKKSLSESETCTYAKGLAETLFHDYPFDNDYRKEIVITLNPSTVVADFKPYELGVVAVEMMEDAAKFHCYVKYRN